MAEGQELEYGSGGISWSSSEELLLALAVERHGRTNWDRVASELQSRPFLLSLPVNYFTAEICKSKFHALERTYSSGGSSAKQSGGKLPWIEHLKQRRISDLKHQMEIGEASLQLLLEKLKKLRTEQDKELLAHNSVTISIENASPASFLKRSDIFTNTSLSPDDENPKNATQSFNLPKPCSNDRLPNDDFIEDSKNVKSPTLPLTAGRVPFVEGGSLPGEGNMVDGEEALEVCKNGLHLNAMSTEKGMVTVERETNSFRKEEGNFINHEAADRGQGLIQKELLVEGNCVSKNLDMSSHSLKSPEKALANSPDRTPHEAYKLETVDKNSKIHRMIPEIPKSCSVMENEKVETPLHEKHELVNTDVHDADLVQRHSDHIPMQADSCSIADDVSKISLVNQIILLPEIIFSSEKTLPIVTENEIVHAKNSPCQTTLHQNKVGIFPSEVVVSSEDADQPSSITARTESLENLAKPVSGCDLIQKESHADLGDSYEICLREDGQKQQASSLNLQTNVSQDTKVQKNVEHQLKNASVYFESEKVLGDKSQVHQTSDMVAEHHKALQGTVEHNTPKMQEAAGHKPALLNSTGQKLSSHPGDSCDVVKAQRKNAPQEELPKKLKVTENIRKVNKTPPEAHLDIEKLCQKDTSESDLHVSLLANHPSEKKNHKYGNQEGSDESGGDLNLSCVGTVNGAKPRGEVRDLKILDEFETEENKQVEDEKHNDDAIASSEGLDQSLAVVSPKASTMSHEGSDSAQEHSKDVEGLEATRDHADSQAERSEVGSPADGVDDSSLTSKKSRREPRVPGKLQPLLECLRLICSHKFAPIFKQKQESQDSRQYDLLIRRHMDLGMIRARLEEGAYSGSLEFFRDLLLIFQNALVYYPKDSQEYGAATVLRKYAMEEKDKIFRTEASLKQDRPTTRKRDSRKFSYIAKQARIARLPKLFATNEFALNEAVLESEGKSKSVSLSMGGPSSRFDEAEIHQRGDQEVDGRFRGIMTKQARLPSQSVGREESQTLQEFKSHSKALSRKEPKDFGKGASRRPTNSLENTTSRGDALETEKKAVQFRSNLKGSRSRDFPNKTLKISTLSQLATTEEATVQNPARASRSLKQTGFGLKEAHKYSSIKKHVKR